MESFYSLTDVYSTNARGGGGFGWSRAMVVKN
jgi:hypothetical protein